MVLRSALSRTVALFLALCFFMPGASALEAPTKIEAPDILDQRLRKIEIGSHNGLVVVFLSAKCPCSASHLEELIRLAKDFPRFQFVGVHSNANESREPTAAYFQKAALPFPVLQDSGANWADAYRALKTPHAFVVLKDGSVAYQGGVSDSEILSQAQTHYLRKALTDLQAGRTIEIPLARTLGCAILRGEKNDF